MNTLQFPLVILLGPTASGKTALGAALATRFNGEIISADSRQVFKGMDIGTGKDLAEYGDVPYHLIDVAQAGAEFSVFDFVKHFNGAFSEITQRKRLPFLVGGTGLYLNAVIEGYQFTEAPINKDLRDALQHKSHEALVEQLQQLRPNQHNNTDIADRERTLRAIEIAQAEQAGTANVIQVPNINPLILGIRWPREALKQRITQRLKARLDEGMVEEVEQLHQQGVGWSALHYYGLEYRFIAEYLQGNLNFNDLFQKLNAAIHQFSKQQTKWFRRMERNGVKIHWLDEGDEQAAFDLCGAIYSLPHGRKRHH